MGPTSGALSVIMPLATTGEDLVSTGGGGAPPREVRASLGQGYVRDWGLTTQSGLSVKGGS